MKSMKHLVKLTLSLGCLLLLSGLVGISSCCLLLLG